MISDKRIETSNKDENKSKKMQHNSTIVLL